MDRRDFLIKLFKSSNEKKLSAKKSGNRFQILNIISTPIHTKNKAATKIIHLNSGWEPQDLRKDRHETIVLSSVNSMRTLQQEMCSSVMTIEKLTLSRKEDVRFRNT